MINYGLIREKASGFRSALLDEYGSSKITRFKDLQNIILKRYSLDCIEMPLGTELDSIKGLIMKSNRMVSIVVNGDLSESGKILVVVHEVGHNNLGHLNGLRVSKLFDNHLRFCNGYSRTAVMENEANFYTADVMLDDEETLDIIGTYDLAASASILNVPIDILDFKLRLLHQSKKLNRYQDFLSVRSDFLKNTQFEKSAFDYY